MNVSAGPVSDWRSETRGDLSRAESAISGLVSAISGEPTELQVRAIWEAYVFVEKSILFIRVEIDEENPGRFIEARKYRVPDERQALHFALSNLRKGAASFELGDYLRSLSELREARNYLRVLLKSKRSGRVRRTGPTR